MGEEIHNRLDNNILAGEEVEGEEDMVGMEETDKLHLLHMHHLVEVEGDMVGMEEGELLILDRRMEEEVEGDMVMAVVLVLADDMEVVEGVMRMEEVVFV